MIFAAKPILDRERYTRALVTAEAIVSTRKTKMEMLRHEAARRAKPTTLAISDEAREDAVLTANSTATVSLITPGSDSTRQSDRGGHRLIPTTAT